MLQNGKQMQFLAFLQDVTRQVKEAAAAASEDDVIRFEFLSYPVFMTI